MNQLKNYFGVLVFLRLFDIYSAEECNFTQVDCVDCNHYRVCNNGSFQDVFSVHDNGRECNDPVLKKCQTLLNCHVVIAYAIATDECTDIGIYQNKLSESDFYVCLSDSNSGFVKLDFSCLDGEYFDESNLQCESKAFTASATQNASTTATTTVSLLPEVSTMTESVTSFPVTEQSTDETESTMIVTDSTETSPNTDVASSEPPLVTDNITAPSNDSSAEFTTTETASTKPDDLATGTQSSLTSDSAETSTPTVSSTVPDPTCTVPGIFVNPINCKGYYRCSTTLVKFDYLCPGVSYFNDQEMKCSLNMTPACQNQILLSNSTTVSQSVSTTQSTLIPLNNSLTTTASFENTTLQPTTAASTSPASSIPTEKTTSTTSGSSVTQEVKEPFVCSAPGIYADPTNCKTYFRCSSSGARFNYTCPGNTYFNSLIQKCSLNVSPECKKLI